MHFRRTSLALASLAVLSVLATPHVAAAVSAPVSLSLVHDFTFSAPVACASGGEFGQFFSTPAVGDLFGDGRKEIVAAFPDGSVHVWYADTFAEVSGWPKNTGDNVAGSPTIAVLDGDSLPSIIVSSYAGTVNVWNGSGVERAGWPQSSHFGSQTVSKGFFSSVAVGDAFGDGRQELFATGLDQHTYAWFSNGQPLWGWPKLTYDSGLATPALADLQHNGTLSIVTPTDASGKFGVHGGIYWAWGPDGRQLWVHGVDEVPWSSPAITDFGDGNDAIVNGTGHFYHQTSNPAAGKYIVGLNQGGANRPGYPVPINDVSFGSPAVGDLFANGGREMVEITEGGTMYALYGNGSSVSGFPLSVPAGHHFSAGPAIAPVDSSGQNGIYATGGTQLAVYSMGSPSTPTLVTTPGSAAPYSTPTVADLGGGHLSVVLGSVAGNTSCGQTDTYHVTVWSVAGTNPAALGASSWPTFHGNMQRSGSNLPRNAPNSQPLAPIRVAVTASDASVWTSTGYGSSFTGLGGAVVAAPAVTWVPASSSSGANLYVAIGSDHALYIRSQSYNWRALIPGGSYCLGNPAATVSGPVGLSVLTVGCVAADHTLWFGQTLAAGNGSLPTIYSMKSLGGTLSGDLAASWAGGSVTFFGTSTSDGRVWTESVLPGNSWTQSPWACTGHPGVGASGQTAYFACEGTDGALWFATNAGFGWAPPLSAGGSILGGVGVAPTSSGATAVVEGVDGTVWQRALTTSGASGGWLYDAGHIQYGVGAV